MYYANGGRVAQFDSPEALFPSALHFSGEGELFPVHIFYEDDDDGEAFAKGGLARSALSVKHAGRHGDTEIVHMNKEELEELKQMWGEPTINPETGQPEFFLKGLWKGIKKVAKPIARIAPIAAAFIPGIGPVASAAIGAVSGGITGGLKGALLGGALGGFGKAISAGLQGTLGIANPVLSRAAAGALMGGAASGIMGGNVLKGALLGGATAGAIGPKGLWDPTAGQYVAPTSTSSDIIARVPTNYNTGLEIPSVSLPSGIAPAINPANLTLQTPALNNIASGYRPSFSPGSSASSASYAAPTSTSSDIIVRAPALRPMVSIDPTSGQIVSSGAGGMGGPYQPATADTASNAAAPATKPNFWNQKALEKYGIGIKNKYLIGGALGAAALADSMRKQPSNADTMDARNQFFGKDFFDGSGGGGFRLASVPSLGSPVEAYERDYLSGYAGGGDVHRGGGRESFAVRGPGDGRSDDIPAMLSDGEYVIDAETVALLGNGSPKAGADKLDDLRVQIRKHKGRKLAKGKISPDAKPALRYMAGGRI